MLKNIKKNLMQYNINNIYMHNRTEVYRVLYIIIGILYILQYGFVTSFISQSVLGDTLQCLKITKIKYWRYPRLNPYVHPGFVL